MRRSTTSPRSCARTRRRSNERACCGPCHELHLDEKKVARRVGVHKSVVSRTLALLKKLAEIHKLVAEESISPRHLRSLESIADESKRVELAEQAAKEHLTSNEIRRRAREAAKSLSAEASDAASSSVLPEIPKHADDENSHPSSSCSSETIAKPSTEIEKPITDEIERSAPLSLAARTPATIQQTAGGDSNNRSTVASPKPVAKPPAEIQKTSIADTKSPADSPGSIIERPKSVAPSEAHSPPTEIDRRAPEPTEKSPCAKVRGEDRELVHHARDSAARSGAQRSLGVLRAFYRGCDVVAHHQARAQVSRPLHSRP